MAETLLSGMIPAHLLLATDLSARCDRALDRAGELAKAWRAELTAVHVLDLHSMPDQALAWMSGESDAQAKTIAHGQLARDIAGLGIEARIRIERNEEPARALLDIASKGHCDLVIMGVAGRESFGRFLLGSTVERLARSLHVPLLVVRNRPYGDYRRIVVATDFSDSSNHALQTTARLFPQHALVLYHAHQAPLGVTLDAAAFARIRNEILQGECRDFLAAARLPATTIIEPVIEQGAPEAALASYVRTHDIDLVSMGSHGRSGVMSVLLGSCAIRLLEWLPCDTLLVREPRATP